MNQVSFVCRRHAMVRCRACDLAYVDRLPSMPSPAASYHAADCDSANDAADAHARKIGYSYA